MRSRYVSSLEPDPAVRARVESLSEKRIGLVLAGGGGKGAYQAGCLEYLSACGVRDFEVIAGASAGSLNAVAAGAGKVGELVKVWQNMSFRQVLSPSWRMIFVPLGAPFAFPQNSHYVVEVVSLILFVGIEIFLWAVNWTGLFATLLLLFVLFLLNAPGVLFVLVQTWAGFSRSYMARHASISRTLPLRRLIMKTFFEGSVELRIERPVYVTLTSTEFWFDPDNPRFGSDTGFRTSMSHFDVEKPRRNPGSIPSYFDLRGLGKEELVDYLTASAALPLAFRQVKIGNCYYSDGGIADNEPLNKVLEFNCDAVIVIYLDHKASPKNTLRHIPVTRRDIELARQPMEQSHGLYIRWLNRKFSGESSQPEPGKAEGDAALGSGGSTESPRSLNTSLAEGVREEMLRWLDPVIPGRFEIVPLVPLGDLPRIINVIPSRSLGGLVRGTLNFSRRKARRLLNLGWIDMETVLRTLEF